MKIKIEKLEETFKHKANTLAIEFNHIFCNIDDNEYSIKLKAENARHYIKQNAIDHPFASEVLDTISDTIEIGGEIALGLYDWLNC